ncbi:minor head protein [Stenotrophomonas phage B2]|nr:minor head protein [Stenotrophomonas phage B2]
MKILSDKRVKWGQERQAEQFQGLQLAHPTAAASKYEEQLSSMIEAMLKDYDRALTRRASAVTQDESIVTTMARVFRELGKKWASRFAERSTELTDGLVGRVDAFSKKTLGNSLRELSGGLTIKTPDMPHGLYDRLLATTRENVGLIKSIPAQYHERIEQTVMRSIQTGGTGSQALMEEIRKIGHSTEKRANLIAVDQASKLNTAMNDERLKAVGVRKFEWIHSGGGKEPRELHVHYHGQIFDMDDPPVIDERTGERGLPGQLIKCRCRMKPIVDFSQYLES